MNILEFDLKIHIIPSPNLESYCNTDALIASSWKYVYIDKDRYLDRSGAYDKRINFSVTHEIGHLVLHKGFYSKLEITNVKDFYKFFEEIPEPEYKRLEFQANMFAGKLLVPADELKKEIEKISKKIIQKKLASENFGEALSNKFDVSGKVIAIRVLSENITIPDEIRSYFEQTIE
ncbi:ImmA/IrrE family metallo-endopeptidase [Patescibacteria group bacterium]|nr:ImmA/IrrE family metallo-endopeptidase [Patescibacteria group bacterium]